MSGSSDSSRESPRGHSFPAEAGDDRNTSVSLSQLRDEPFRTLEDSHDHQIPEFRNKLTEPLEQQQLSGSAGNVQEDQHLADDQVNPDAHERATSPASSDNLLVESLLGLDEEHESSVTTPDFPTGPSPTHDQLTRVSKSNVDVKQPDNESNSAKSSPVIHGLETQQETLLEEETKNSRESEKEERFETKEPQPESDEKKGPDDELPQQETLGSTPTDNQVYQYPTTGLLSRLPRALVPFGELIRIDKPGGTYMFYAIHIYGVLYAACSMEPAPSIFKIIYLSLVLSIGTFLARSGFCAWNDARDWDVDAKVERTRFRPIARGALTPREGYIFAIMLVALMPIEFFFLPRVCVQVFFAGCALHIPYPFAKRVTSFPQIVLGLGMAMGAIMGMAAMGAIESPPGSWFSFCISSVVPSIHTVPAIMAFYCAIVANVTLFDIIYAQQDVVDDEKAGVKGMAVRFRHCAKLLLSLIAFVSISLFAAAGWLQGFGLHYFAGVAGMALELIITIVVIDLEDVKECAWMFQTGQFFPAGCLILGLVCEYWRNSVALTP